MGKRATIALASAVSLLFIWALSLLMPTFDDWTYITCPFVTGDDFNWHWLLPQGSLWRPFDVLVGRIETLFPCTFPFLNHLIIYITHVTNTVCVFFISRHLLLQKDAARLAAALFFCSAATFGTVLGVDSINQALACAFGLLSVLVFLRDGSIVAWAFLCLLATFAKENGIAFFAMPFIISLIKKDSLPSPKKGLHFLLAGIILMIAYGAARLALNVPTAEMNSEYTGLSLGKMTVNLVKIILPTFLPIDYISVFYPPRRSVFLTGFTLLLCAPMLWISLRTFCKEMRSRFVWVMLLCWLASVSAHLVTVASSMHSYAGLWAAAILIAWLYEKSPRRHWLIPTLYIAAAVISLAHHYECSRQSGITGQRMAASVLSQMNSKPDTVAVITIDRGEPRYSSFCTAPHGAFGWGAAVRIKTGFKWPKAFDSSMLTEEDDERIAFLCDSVMNEGIKTVWLVDGDSVRVLFQEKETR